MAKFSVCRIYKVTLWLNFSYNYSVNLLQILHLYIHPDKTAESHNFCVRSIFSVDYGVPLKCLFLYIFQRFVKPHYNWLFTEMHSLLSHICHLIWSVEILFIYIVGVWLALSEDIRNCVGPSSVWETCGLTLRYSYNGREHKGFVWEFR